jgi:hypothetical protein
VAIKAEEVFAAGAATVAERAYYKAERRGFAPGHELEDWLAAEREVAALLAADERRVRWVQRAKPRKNPVKKSK